MVAYMDHKDLGNRRISSERAVQIADGVKRVAERIAKAEDSAGRKEGSVTLLAATKTRDVGEIMAAIDAGVRRIGENRPQEVTAKAQGLLELCRDRGLALGVDATDNDSSSLGFHLIGQLQSNKINKILPYVDTVESVDGPSLARKLATRALAAGRTVGILLEVNESGEQAKSGCAPDQALDLAYELAAMEGIRLKGLMTVGAHVDDEAVIRSGFAHLRGLRDRIRDSGQPGTDTCTMLSMGMTGDMEYAVAEGSTEVRVGTAIFGPRAFI
ncbi:YggS family pyridoxal phosphate-dependent enzyme [Bifidobacterium sp. W8109]|uniref:Pyridoxal phosphate homeostasis protein n=1 Tax=Bifidobacterium asteroides DSM 20089 TaxID=1437594 RepID=A0AAD0ABU3_9BIFI|nr:MULTISPECIES: YggS family pyridoxal phosphate-dependent enzyme [Bifidobacterium]AFU72088.1 alanine racemase domain protein [Bifidobacterium asteroides PRL2011]ATO41876.1 YggS family pyridoxal phosphate enzyme [Bifidobacterium asteroides DSM 20089]MBH9971191.1 YggS family pyridoxal phosphate-dependent enzyme [Bifidobacterium asteroides]MBH9980010.1 YggS family pyridoxal phosphate-dependent enzyme [Bifidobacterium asteroides]MBH9983792.1 YggS family pyridoxal phosphate-dependent enzyme [Bifid